MEDNAIGGLSQLDPSLFANRTTKSEKNEDINKQEFMQLLVTQLKNQDPLDPMKNEEFAVQLAQFTQVEQLVALNEKFDRGNANEMDSLASYLGNEVWLNSDQVSVRGGNGGEVAFEIANNASTAQLELVDSSGAVRETVNLGALQAGPHRINLEGLSTSSGDFQARVVGLSEDGTKIEPEVSVAGVVSGFVPGPNPVLLVGDREVSTTDIKRVQIPSS
ncbi:MAG: hypothetical protein KDD60_01185 [Bdellovibrionales bacterium]|nr:hypothetical protein [Bdellovibrionales bacterium]